MGAEDQQKNGEGLGELSCEWTQSGCRGGGEGPIFKYVHIEIWKRVSYWSRWVVSKLSFTLMFGAQIYARVFEWIIQCILFWWLGPSPLRPPHLHLVSTSCPPLVHLTSFTWWILQAFPIFHRSSAPVYYCEDKRKVKAGKAKEQGYIWHTYWLENALFLFPATPYLVLV